jgi:hypothetical protein
VPGNTLDLVSVPSSYSSYKTANRGTADDYRFHFRIKTFAYNGHQSYLTSFRCHQEHAFYKPEGHGFETR